ncbi:hypothetical protein J6590_025952 [Homalodisca vitripennis]|nr:hypothetical protein J6590_025952 [Homalodisca vitripennis]
MVTSPNYHTYRCQVLRPSTTRVDVRYFAQLPYSWLSGTSTNYYTYWCQVIRPSTTRVDVKYFAQLPHLWAIGALLRFYTLRCECHAFSALTLCGRFHVYVARGALRRSCPRVARRQP